MTKAPRVTGVIQCKNEWGILALSITHALIHHVDEVYVLNDSSTDESFQGLQRLQALWPGRLHVFHQNNGIFLQEAQLNTLVLLARQSNPDWLYVFDADEFLLPSPRTSLREILARVPEDCAAIRYNLRNFVCPRNFNERSTGDYSSIHYEGLPDPNLSLKFSERYQAIYEEKLNLFHIPFPSKVIFRNLDSIRVLAGAHDIVHYTGKPMRSVSIDSLYTAHLSWLSMDRLKRKAEQGKKHVDNGLPRRHGWQNQLIHQVACDNRLARFWERHSLPGEGQPTDLAPRNIRKNADFREGIRPAVEALIRNGFDAGDLSIVDAHRLAAGAASPTAFQFTDLIQLTHRHHKLLGEHPAAKHRQTLLQSLQRLGSRLIRSLGKRWRRLVA
ncbi:glycosyltransferase family 2 protein [Holophaga foetida]|uniref:glycosyltransferase family 2 protein n=1 Tax=Holophaga foetida TaxID=35839 RepID=UPI0002473387|nr:glycosyltransferase family 2 protein [Holophaga foetida]